MSEVKRFWVHWNDQLYVADKNGDLVMAEDFDRVTAERDALQVLLTAADERADVLEGLLRRVHKSSALTKAGDLWKRIDAALKPAEVRCNIPACDYQIDMDQN